MADRRVDVLVIGAGVAGASCATTLRAEGFEGSVLLVGRELDAPYQRPPATKGYLQGRERRDDALFRPPPFWEDHGIELLTRTSVMGLDLGERTAALQGGSEVSFGQAVLATGAMVRRLPLPGTELEGVHYVRTLRNADAIRRDLESAERVLLVGGSYIGCEVAASLTTLGHRCTLVMQEDVCLERTLGPTMGRRAQAVMEEHGIDVLPRAEVERFDGEGRVRSAILTDGRELPADLVVIGAGAVPDVMLARRAGLEIGPRGGIACSPRLETSAAGVFAAGDSCEHESVLHGRAVRIEHHEVAIAQGQTAARSVLGGDEPHDVVPYFWSDLADWITIESVGPPENWDAEDERGATVVHLRDDRVVGAATTGGAHELAAARELLRAAAPR
jgi:3-phenylpropionate/trans-cinnamate dioxygenase ferredoxin reductase component